MCVVLKTVLTWMERETRPPPKKTNETHQHCSQPHEIVPREMYDSGAYLAECGAFLQPFRNQTIYMLET